MPDKNAQQKKRDLDFIRCPCCGKRRKIQTQTRLVAIQQAFSNNWLCHGDWAVRFAKARSIRWACNDCLQSGAAIEGRPEKQTFVDFEPYLAYIDRLFTCEDCHCSFVFSAQEQQYWYEELKFWVQSHPKQCPECRRKRRAKRQAMQDIQKELSQLDPEDPQQLLRLASLYLQVENSPKAQEYVAKASKRARDRGESELFAEQIAILQSQIKTP